MANGKSEANGKRIKEGAKKADIILDTDREILEKVGNLSHEISKTNERLNSLSGAAGGETSSRKITEVHDALQREIDSIKSELKYLAAQSESIYLAIQTQIQNLTSALGVVPVGGAGSPENAPSLRAEIDYDKLAAKVAEQLPAQEYISPDYIACKVAEQIIVPESASSKHVRVVPAEGYQTVSAPVSGDLSLDEEELADKIAVKIGGIQSRDFEILVDDEGCSSISRNIAENLNYDLIASAIAEKMRSALEYFADRETDYDEVASRIGDKIKISGISEDAIAEKAAAVLSGYLPEIDVDEIADKVVSQLVSVMPAAEVDSKTVSDNIMEKLIENQENHDYDIVLDDEGINKITGHVAEEISKTTAERFDKMEREIAELKAMIAAGAVMSVSALDGSSEETPLVTVSDLINEQNEDGGDDEIPTVGKIIGESGEAAGGVDFENMMKYDRSFIARIIQSTDEQKEYYGSVKTALLSYAKVNSNVAWGAERFNKGRETVARFKIRGKTLCLYLALDPTEYPYSVYHQVNVSDNKSLHGTPMMVKIKSPRGAKKAIRLIDEMLEKRGAVKRNKVIERDYASMYPYETIEELIEDGLVKEVSKN